MENLDTFADNAESIHNIVSRYSINFYEKIWFLYRVTANVNKNAMFMFSRQLHQAFMKCITDSLCRLYV